MKIRTGQTHRARPGEAPDAGSPATDGREICSADNSGAKGSWYEGTNRAVLGDVLLCAGDRETYGRCAPIPIPGPNAMILVHPSVDFDTDAGSAPGAREAVLRAQEEGIPVVYLVQAYDSFEDMFLSELVPTHYVRSYDGLHTLDFEGDHLVMAGGYLQNCLRTAFREILKRRRTDRPLTVSLPAAAIFADIDDVKTLAASIAAQSDAWGWLRGQAALLMQPRGSDIETSAQVEHRDYDVEVCFRGACEMLAPAPAGAPKLRIMFE